MSPKFPMKVWHDKAGLLMQCKSASDDSTRLLMTFSGKVCNDKAASILIDSGATHNFVDAKYAKKSNMHVLPESGQVSCAGNAVASIQGYTKIHLDLQSFHGMVKMYVIDLPQDNDTDLILGQTWLTDHQASLDYADKCVKFIKEGKKLSLTCQDLPMFSNEVPLLNLTQLKREMRKENNVACTVFVHAASHGNAGGEEEISIQLRKVLGL